MHLAKYTTPAGTLGVGSVQDTFLVPLLGADPSVASLSDILEADDPQAVVSSLSQSIQTIVSIHDVTLLPPIDSQEVWAAGVTYKRSQSARMEESEVSASSYDRVYEADRPEIFLKATPHRVVGPNQPVRIRADSQWNVPEPELTLVLNSRLCIVGLTVGNDVSSRDIEGENPLYLPQAKVYNQSCALGPWITLSGSVPDAHALQITLQVQRDDEIIYQGATSTAQMARTFEDLVAWLGRDNSFPNGAFLMTGTGIVPDSSFTLMPDDIVTIEIDGVGVLSNPVRGKNNE